MNERSYHVFLLNRLGKEIVNVRYRSCPYEGRKEAYLSPDSDVFGNLIDMKTIKEMNQDVGYKKWKRRKNIESILIAFWPITFIFIGLYILIEEAILDCTLERRTKKEWENYQEYIRCKNAK